MVIIPAHSEEHACRSSVCLPVNCDSAAVSVHRVSQKKRPNPGSSALVHDADVEVPWLGILILGHVRDQIHMAPEWVPVRADNGSWVNKFGCVTGQYP